MSSRQLAADDFQTIRDRMKQISEYENHPCTHSWDSERICTQCKVSMQELIDKGDYPDSHCDYGL